MVPRTTQSSVGALVACAAKSTTLHLPGGQNLDRPRSSLITEVQGAVAGRCFLIDDGGKIISVQDTRDWNGSP
jgi:hypothetical protein